MATVDPIEILEDLARSGAEIWQSLVSAGASANEDLTEANWTIGDCAHIVAMHRSYGENLVRDYAEEIGCNLKSVREYQRVSRFWWAKSRRLDLRQAQNLFYSHFQDAVQFADVKQATRFLNEVAHQNWTIKRARIEIRKLLGKPVPPAQLLPSSEACIVGITRARITLDVVNIDLECNDALMEAWRSGKPVKVVITELEAKTS